MIDSLTVSRVFKTFKVCSSLMSPVRPKVVAASTNPRNTEAANEYGRVTPRISWKITPRTKNRHLAPSKRRARSCLETLNWGYAFAVISVNRYRRGLETCPQAKTSKGGHAIIFSFFPTRPSDEYDSAPSRKWSRPLLDVFACIG